MHIEYECTYLEVNEKEFIKLLEKNKAKKVGEYFQKRYTYDFNPVNPSKWIRLRTKDVKNKNIIGGTEETEIEVSDLETTNKILNELGYIHRNYQENKRITYELDGVEIDIDSWPLIPTYVEIEGKNEEEVEKIIEKLNLDKNKITNYDVTTIYEKIYNIDVLSIKELRFK